MSKVDPFPPRRRATSQRAALALIRQHYDTLTATLALDVMEIASTREGMRTLPKEVRVACRYLARVRNRIRRLEAAKPPAFGRSA